VLRLHFNKNEFSAMPYPQKSPVTHALHYFGVWSKLVLAFVLLAASSSHAVTPELLVLQQQYAKLLNERVTTVYEASVVQLNARYLEAVDRSITTVKAAGDLNEVLALENEKNLINDKKPIPDDDADTKASVRKLRAVYREQLSKLENQRSTDHAAILEPYLTRLKTLEVDLTKTNRVAEAKEVMDYRSGLDDDPASVPVSAISNGVLTNSLGMKFLPVKGTTVHFCIHETRREDYIAFANEVPVANTAWKAFVVEGLSAGHEPDHPVVHIEWEDAKKFCEWLSKKESKSYRLPTDKEWSYAVGNGNKEKWTKSATPESLNGKVEDDYPWGRKYPPSDADSAGNYGDKTWAAKHVGNPYVEGYTDGFLSTAPVMSFKPNKFGLYDMGGNVSEWVEDWWNDEKIEHTLRGGGWQSAGKNLLSSARYTLGETGTRYYRSYGFRIVLERP
jgi:hypothetical protein